MLEQKYRVPFFPLPGNFLYPFRVLLRYNRVVKKEAAVFIELNVGFDRFPEVTGGNARFTQVPIERILMLFLSMSGEVCLHVIAKTDSQKLTIIR